MASEAVEVETGRDPSAAVIWLHGLGADGHDFEPVVPQLAQPQRARPALRVSACARAAGDAQQRVRHARLVRHRGAQSRRRRGRARHPRLAEHHRCADPARERPWHRQRAHRARRLLPGRRDGAVCRHAPRHRSWRASWDCRAIWCSPRGWRRAQRGERRHAHIPRARFAGPGGGAGARRGGAPAAGRPPAMRWSGMPTACLTPCARRRSWISPRGCAACCLSGRGSALLLPLLLVLVLALRLGGLGRTGRAVVRVVRRRGRAAARRWVRVTRYVRHCSWRCRSPHAVRANSASHNLTCRPDATRPAARAGGSARPGNCAWPGGTACPGAARGSRRVACGGACAA